MRTIFKFNTKALQVCRDSIRRQITQCLLDRAPRASQASSNRVVFVRWDGKLGDSIVLSWVYRALAQARPDLQITVLTHADLVQMHQRDFGVEGVIVCSKRPGLREIFALARQVRHARYVVHLSETFRPRDFLFLRLVQPAHVVGLDDAVRAVDIKLGAYTADRHFSQKLQPWLASLGIENPDTTYIVPQATETLARVRQNWPDYPVTGFCPAGAGRGRRLSDERIQVLLRRMRATSDHGIMLLVPPELREKTQRMLSAMGDPKLLLAPDTGDLSGLFATIRLCDAIVSVDTAVVHIAAGLNKPLLALYNPDRNGHANFTNWHPNSDKAVSLFATSVDPQSIDAIEDEPFEQAYRGLLTQSGRLSAD